MITPWPMLAAAAISMGAGFAGGYALSSRLSEAALARAEAVASGLREQMARERAAAEIVTSRRYAQAAAAEQTASAALQEARARARDTERRLRDAIHTSAADGCAMGGDARRLLNDAIAAAADPVPADTAGTAGAAAAAAADTAPASEHDIALWAASVITHYEECRARVDAIRRWDEGAHGR